MVDRGLFRGRLRYPWKAANLRGIAQRSTSQHPWFRKRELSGKISVELPLQLLPTKVGTLSSRCAQLIR